MAQTSEYQKRQDGNSTVFEVTPAEAPKFLWMVIMGGISCLLGVFTFPCGLAFLALGGAAIWFGRSYDPRPKAHKQNSSFRVTGETIEANGQTFKKDDIHRLIIKNGMSNEVLTGPTVLVLVLVVAAWAFTGGLLEIFAAFADGETAGTRALFIVAGLVSVVFGLVLFARPGVGAITLALLFGLFELTYGFSQVVMGVQSRRAGRSLAPSPEGPTLSRRGS